MRPSRSTRFAPHAALLAFTCAALAAPAAYAGPGGGGDFGLGIIIGEPTGLSGKLWLDNSQAVDFLLAFSIDDDYDDNIRRLLFGADYLFHFDAFKPRSVELPLYVGIGGKIVFFDRDNGRFRDDDDDFGLALRIPLGISLLLKSAPLEFFVEIVPGLFILPGTNADLDAGLGARYYF